MADMSINREDSPKGGRYTVRINGEEAEMTYSRAGSTRIIIDHTGVPDSMRGLGVGKQLVEAAVNDARAEGFKIIPLCPFAKATLEKHAEWQDVVQ
ncbi:MAG: N-acetyltransferase [Hyphomonas sp.]|nr:N-acetyltransferase [Hyphomonas sp.]